MVQITREILLTVMSWIRSLIWVMRSGDFSPMGGEVDETYIGRLKDTPVKSGGGAHKNTVVTLVECGGRARSFHVDTARIGTAMPIVRANIVKESALMTDEAGMYRRVGQEFASHDVVAHSKDEYVRYEGEKTVHTNTAISLNSTSATATALPLASMTAHALLSR